MLLTMFHCFWIGKSFTNICELTSLVIDTLKEHLSTTEAFEGRIAVMQQSPNSFYFVLGFLVNAR